MYHFLQQGQTGFPVSNNYQTVKYLFQNVSTFLHIKIQLSVNTILHTYIYVYIIIQCVVKINPVKISLECTTTTSTQQNNVNKGSYIIMYTCNFLSFKF